MIDVLGDHLRTCTSHTGVKKVHDWVVPQLPDLFRTTHKVKTQQVSKSRGHRCGDIEFSSYLSNAECPVPLVRFLESDVRVVEVPVLLVINKAKAK